MFFADYVYVEVTSADIPRMLREVEQMHIEIRNVKIYSDLSVEFAVLTKNYPCIVKRLEQLGADVVCKSRHGMIYVTANLLRRPILMIGVSLMIFLTLFLPTRVLFVEIAGNQKIPERLIIQMAEECGICFGASRRTVRSEQVKNALLVKIPQLQWAGVNTSGCVATISVKEKPISEQQSAQDNQVSSIIASQDGVITECVVRRGNLLCNVGQAVVAGQMLVSGYIDCGLTVQATCADAEIMAETLRNLTVICPSWYSVRSSQNEMKVRYSLQLGKKLINFYKGSGISDMTCVKMYSKKYLTLPGGRTLPVVLITERELHCNIEDVNFVQSAGERHLSASAQNYLSEQMVSGEILSTQTDLYLSGDTYILTGEYACLEMIGKIKSEESLYTNGKDD